MIRAIQKYGVIGFILCLVCVSDAVSQQANEATHQARQSSYLETVVNYLIGLAVKSKSAPNMHITAVCGERGFSSVKSTVRAAFRIGLAGASLQYAEQIGDKISIEESGALIIKNLKFAGAEIPASRPRSTSASLAPLVDEFVIAQNVLVYYKLGAWVQAVYLALSTTDDKLTIAAEAFSRNRNQARTFISELKGRDVPGEVIEALTRLAALEQVSVLEQAEVNQAVQELLVIADILK